MKEQKFIVTKSQLRRIVQKASINDIIKPILDKNNSQYDSEIKQLQDRLDKLTKLKNSLPKNFTVSSKNYGNGGGNVSAYIEDESGVIVGNNQLRNLWKEVIPLLDKSTSPKYDSGMVDFNKPIKVITKEFPLSTSSADLAKYINSLLK